MARCVVLHLIVHLCILVPYVCVCMHYHCVCVCVCVCFIFVCISCFFVCVVVWVCVCVCVCVCLWCVCVCLWVCVCVCVCKRERGGGDHRVMLCANSIGCEPLNRVDCMQADKILSESCVWGFWKGDGVYQRFG